MLALAGALSYSELAAAFPEAGGEYIYLREAFGLLWGYLSGWTSFFAGFSAPIGAAAIGFAAYLSYFTPVLAPDHLLWSFPIGPLRLRISAGQMKLILAPVDPLILMQRALALFRPLAEEKNIHLELAVSPSEPVADSAPGQRQQPADVLGQNEVPRGPHGMRP